MQWKAIIGVILVIAALIMVGISLILPWYQLETDMSLMGMSLDYDAYYYLDHAEVQLNTDFGGMNTSQEISYDNESIKDSNIVKTFRTTQIFVLVGLVGCIIGLFGSAMVMLGKFGPKLGALFILIAVILTLIAPLYLMFTLPNAFEEDTESDISGTSGDKMGKDFFGSVNEGEGDTSLHISWGGSIGWFLALFAMILCIPALILVFISTPEPRGEVYTRPSMPMDMYTEPSVPETYNEDYYLKHDEHIEEEPYPEEEDIAPGSFIPLSPPTSGEGIQSKRARYQCPSCGKALIVYVQKRPLNLTCDSCGFKGTIE